MLLDARHADDDTGASRSAQFRGERGAGKLGTSSLKKSHRWPTCWTLPTKRLTYHKVAQAGPPCVLNTTMLSWPSTFISE